MESRIPKVSPGRTYDRIPYRFIESAAGRRAPNSPCAPPEGAAAKYSVVGSPPLPFPLLP
jgi:hypothetical protein